MRGSVAGDITVEMIRRTIVTEGDIILTSGWAAYPADVLIGQITGIHKLKRTCSSLRPFNPRWISPTSKLYW